MKAIAFMGRRSRAKTVYTAGEYEIEFIHGEVQRIRLTAIEAKVLFKLNSKQDMFKSIVLIQL